MGLASLWRRKEVYAYGTAKHILSKRTDSILLKPTCPSMPVTNFYVGGFRVEPNLNGAHPLSNPP